MKENITLDMLWEGKSAKVKQICGAGEMTERLLDLGLVEGTKVECIGKHSMRGIAAYCIRGTVIAIRGKDAKKIVLEGGEWSGGLQKHCTFR